MEREKQENILVQAVEGEGGERKKEMGVDRKSEISKGEEEADTQRGRGWMLSCIDLSSPPPVTSLTCPTSGL